MNGLYEVAAWDSRGPGSVQEESSSATASVAGDLRFQRAWCVPPASVCWIELSQSFCCFIRHSVMYGKQANLGTALETGFHATGQPLQAGANPL